MISKDDVRAVACWPRARLEQALALWPHDSVTWSWFLGARLAGMTRRDAELRVAVVLNVARSLGIRLPLQHHIRRWFGRATLAQWLIGVRLLGAYLDATEDELGEARARLVAALTERMPPRAPNQDERLPAAAECGA